MIAVALIRAGSVPAGTDEAVCEAGGDVVLVGTGTSQAADALGAVARSVWTMECSKAGSWPAFASLAELAVEALRTIGRLAETIIVPASPDGRDLAPHMARLLDRPFFAGAVEITDTDVSVVQNGGLQISDVQLSGPVVCTLQVSSRGIDVRNESATITALSLSAIAGATTPESGVVTVDVLPPDAATMDLSEAPRIVGGGAGLASADSFATLEAVAAAIDASMGVTRVITDRGWASHDRQIGTTGVVVDPRLYLSFGISGAVQHTSGLGQPEHIISVNTDPHCPMMQMSDLAIVADANEVLDELASILGISPIERAS